jgi:hypothetical protein
MKLSPRARWVAGVLVFVAAVTYLVIVDLGWFAGRVHHGVTVEGHDVAGLSFPELVDELEERRDDLMDRTIVFRTEGFTDSVTPADLRWNPQPFDTARATYAVGRSGIIDSMEQRVRGWLGGVEVAWDGGVRPRLLAKLIASWEEEIGVPLDHAATADLVRSAIASGATGALEIPLLEPVALQG